jgi:hypothetical protein
MLAMDENLAYQANVDALYSKVNGKLWLDAVYGRTIWRVR